MGGSQNTDLEWGFGFDTESLRPPTFTVAYCALEDGLQTLSTYLLVGVERGHDP